jgi:uncharacterized membrane protein YccF (DUF307 family)
MGLFVRFVWFLLIGWWLGFIWVTFWIASMMAVVTIPIAKRALGRTWAIVTMRKAPDEVVREAIAAGE